MTQQSTALHFNASANSFESYVLHDHQYELDGSTVLRGGAAIPAECCKVQRKVRSKLFKALVLLCFAFDLLMLFVCPELSRNAFGGVQGRRLSEGNGNDDDDLSLPSTPELLDLCFGIGSQLSSEEILPEAPRASPLMVQEFLDELEQEGETQHVVGPVNPLDAPPVQNLMPPTLGLSVKRPASDDGEDDDEVAGPSSKVAKTDNTPSPPWSVSSSETKESSPSSAAESTESGDFVSSVASGSLESEEFLDFLNFPIPELEPSDAPPVPPSVSTDASRSSAAAGPGPPSAPSGDDTRVHPWLRVPDFTPGKGDMEFRPECLRWPVDYRYHGPLMVKMRKLLVQPKLDYAQARRLVIYSQYLANHAFHEQRGPVSSRRPTDAAELLGRRFMIFFLLHSASRALRRPWPQQQWWRDLASVIPSKCPFTPGGKGLNSGSKASVDLAVQLSAAIELYKSGSAPDSAEVVDIMRKLFCSPVSPHHFKAASWDPWRHDDDSSSSSS
ncbi:hypothetical protein Emed_003741 [Eimeria media]